MSEQAGNDGIAGQAEPGKRGLTRRQLLQAGVAAGVVGAVAGPVAAASAVVSEPPPPGNPDIILTRGKIHTMDAANSVVSSVAIKDGKFVAFDRDRGGPDTRVIDLRGRTVIPGLIESHTHYVSLANRVGHHVAEVELSRSNEEFVAYLAERRPQVPEGEFITAMGGWNPNHWPDGRLPTMAELDAAIPDRPVWVMQGTTGPSRVNSLGKAFFETVESPLAGPVEVSADGVIASGAQSLRALYHMRVRHTLETKQRSAVYAQKYSAKVGVTTVLDQTLPPSPGPLTPSQSLFALDHYRMYDGWLAAHAADENYIRLQINFLHSQGYNAALGDLDNQLPELRERLKNQFPFFGNDWVRTGGIGEWAASFAAPTNANGHAVWRESQRLVAQARWRNENAQTSAANVGHVLDAYEACDAEFGIKDLRWGIQHADGATPEQLQRAKALNVGISTSGFRWQTLAPASGVPVGPLFPQMVESGVKLALHEDGVHIAPHNAWFALHYATTGLDRQGNLSNPGQQISRLDALRLYTTGAAWYLNREDDLGSIEVGKFADLLVLDRDYFTVSDADMRRTLPVLTVVDGKVVHDTGVLR